MKTLDFVCCRCRTVSAMIETALCSSTLWAREGKTQNSNSIPTVSTMSSDDPENEATDLEPKYSSTLWPVGESCKCLFFMLQEYIESSRKSMSFWPFFLRMKDDLRDELWTLSRDKGPGEMYRRAVYTYHHMVNDLRSQQNFLSETVDWGQSDLIRYKNLLFFFDRIIEICNEVKKQISETGAGSYSSCPKQTLPLAW